MKIACYCLLNTVLNKLFHITDVYRFSTIQIITKLIHKNDPVQKFTTPLNLILCVVCWMIHECFSVFWQLFMSPSLVLNSSCCSSEKSSSSCIFFGFPASSAYLNPFQQWLYDFEIHLFTWRTTGGLIHNYYIRWKHLLMLKKATQCIKSRGGGVNFLNWMIRVNCTYSVFWETFKYLCSFLSVVPN